MTARITIALLLAVILGVPFALTTGRESAATHADPDHTLIIITPHVPQIRDEFARGFARWHERVYGQKVAIDWRTPGGTSEIRKQLDAVFQAEIKKLYKDHALSLSPDDGFTLPPGTIDYDLFFGGGSYDHGAFASGVAVSIDENNGAAETHLTLKVPQSVPAGFTQQELDDIFGPNAIGPQHLYAPDQRWIGTALSSFGIVYNRDVYRRLGLDPPTKFADLGDARLIGWVALADPRQSGSVTTTFDSILGNQGWDEGWKTLRRMCGTTRYFTNSSTKPPIDVSMGEAAVGLAIDFYGRGQAQVISDTGGGDRVGYTDPAGAVYVDADPISLVNGAPHPELAKRFIRYCLTDEAQALWQFRAHDPTNPKGPDGEPMGPIDHELRRMPVTRSMYAMYFDSFVDKVNPFDIVSDIANPGWRSGVTLMMGCFGVDLADECRAAYAALDRARASGKFSEQELADLEARFFAFPTTRIESVSALADDAGLSDAARAVIDTHKWKWIDEVRAWSPAPTDDPAADAELHALTARELRLPFSQPTYNAVRNEWKQLGREARLKIEYARFFRDSYESIVREVDAR